MSPKPKMSLYFHFDKSGNLEIIGYCPVSEVKSQGSFIIPTSPDVSRLRSIKFTLLDLAPELVPDASLLVRL